MLKFALCQILTSWSLGRLRTISNVVVQVESGPRSFACLIFCGVVRYFVLLMVVPAFAMCNAVTGFAQGRRKGLFSFMEKKTEEGLCVCGPKMSKH